MVASGLFALAGVLVGAFSTALMTYFFSRREEDRRLQVATRLVREEILEAGPALETTLKRGWIADIELRLDSWQEHRAVLAGRLSEAAWEEVADAFMSLQRVKVMLAVLLRGVGG